MGRSTDETDKDRSHRAIINIKSHPSYSERLRYRDGRGVRKRRILEAPTTTTTTTTTTTMIDSINDIIQCNTQTKNIHQNDNLASKTNQTCLITSQAQKRTTSKSTNHHNINKRHNQQFKLTTFMMTSWTIMMYLLIFISQHPLQHPDRPFACLGFNIDTQHAVVHSGLKGSYFGYTVAQHKDRGVNWLLVGAPKTQTDQPGTKQSGAVYKCAPNNAKACQQIPFDPNGSSVITLRGEQVKADDKSHQWFGASLQSANDNGSIVACAPKYVYFSTNLKRRDPVGKCWISRGSFSGFLEYSPCRLDDQWGHHHLGSCQAGFSSAITKDGSRLFMGSPGSHVWQGQVFARNLKTDLTNSTSWVNPHSEDDSYLGYSLALGKFSSGSSSSAALADQQQSDVAIGMPRGNDLAGKVMLVDKEMRTLRNITGEQLGAYFGYSLTTADLNGDGLDDLIIGAPLYYNQTTSHKEPHFDRGRIYIAQQNSRHEFNLIQRIDGQKNRARFGTSLANCGDLNRDGYQDIAVGAPYDGPDQHGAVYIYLGRKSGGVSEDYDQVIYAESVRNEGHLLRSFGFSLSAGLDVDANGYPDLLVGDYEADRAVLLRARPVVNADTSLTFTPENFNLDDKSCLLPNSSTSVSCITVTYCTKYTGQQVDPKMTFVYDIKLDTENKGAPRLFLLQNEGKSEDRATSVLTKDVKQCKSFKTYVMKQIRDKLTPLKIDIDYNLADTGPETVDYSTGQVKLKPILNKSSGGANKLTKVATIQKNCGPDNVCVPDLRLTITPNLEQYIIGSNEKLILDVTVRNYGEDAFESMFYLTMPSTINYNNFNRTRSDYPICYGVKPDQSGLNVLTCDLGNPQRQNDVVKFSVITEPARGQFSSPDFTFVGLVNSTNPEQDDRHREDNQVALGIPIKVEVQLVLSGNSQPPLIVHNSSLISTSATVGGSSAVGAGGGLKMGKLSEADIGPEVYHIYQLQNRGPSTINDIALTILWPTKNNEGKYLLYLVDEPFTSDKVKCKPAPQNSINPLALRYLRENSFNYPLNSPQNDNRSGNNGTRYRRQTSSEGSSQPSTNSVVDQSIVSQQMSLLSCGQTDCTRFECNVNDLGHNEIATIRIRSRLFEETINELSLQEYVISSKLLAQVKSLPYNVSSLSMPPYIYKVETQVHTSGLAVQNLLPWWLIVLAILLGILLFILLACFLKYLGFFARKRPPKGTAEREPLTPTNSMWNDYHYTPGDTAL